MDKLVELMNDSFGNYLIQKVLEKLDENKLKDTIRIVIKYIYLDYSTFFESRFKSSWDTSFTEVNRTCQ